MPIQLSCKCGKKLRVADDAAGKRVKCPQCKATLPVPVAEALEDDAPPPSKKIRPAPVEEEDRPRKSAAPKAKPREEDDEEDRPRKAKSRDDDYEDDRPRKANKSAKPGGTSKGKILLLAGVGVAALVAVCVTLWLMLSGPGESQLLGIWVVDEAATQQMDPVKNKTPQRYAVEFLSGGKCRASTDHTSAMTEASGTWKIAGRDKGRLKLELDLPRSPFLGDLYLVTPKSADQLMIEKTLLFNQTLLMKRVASYPVATDNKQPPVTPVGEKKDPKLPKEEKKPPAPLKEYKAKEVLEPSIVKGITEQGAVTLLLSEDGKRIAVASSYFEAGKGNAWKVQIWDIAGKPKKLSEIPGRFESASPDLSRVLTFQDKKKTFAVFIADTGVEIAKVQGTPPFWLESKDFLWAIPNEAAGRNDPQSIKYRKIDASTGALLKDYEAHTDLKGTFSGSVFPGKQIAYITEDYHLRFLDLETAMFTKNVRLEIDNIGTFSFASPSTYLITPDAKSLFTHGAKGGNTKVTRFDIDTGLISNSPSVFFLPNRGAPSPDGKLIFIQRNEVGVKFEQIATLVAVDLGTGKETAKYMYTGQAFFGRAVFSQDNSTMAFATDDRRVFIWDLKLPK